MTRAAIPGRRPCGRVRWDTPLLTRIALRLRRGESMAVIATVLGLSAHAVRQGAARHGLTLPPAGEVFVSTLRQEIGVTEKVVYARARQLGITPRFWGQQRTVTLQQAAEIADSWQDTISQEQAEQDGWLSARQAASLLGITWRMFMLRVSAHHVRRAVVLGLPGRPYRYHPDDVRRVPMPVAPRGKPRGYVTAAHLSEITGAGRSTPGNWRRRGCPTTRDRVAFHAHYFQPAAVLSWLEQQDRQRWNVRSRQVADRAIDALRAHLQSSRAA